jgi:hypothetical protein
VAFYYVLTPDYPSGTPLSGVIGGSPELSVGKGGWSIHSSHYLGGWILRISSKLRIRIIVLYIGRTLEEVYSDSCNQYSISEVYTINTLH